MKKILFGIALILFGLTAFFVLPAVGILPGLEIVLGVVFPIAGLVFAFFGLRENK